MKKKKRIKQLEAQVADLRVEIEWLKLRIPPKKIEFRRYAPLPKFNPTCGADKAADDV